MSVRYDQSTGDLVVDGFDQGIASSPHKGIAAIKNANIATEQGEVMCNYSRVAQTITAFSGGTITQLTGSTFRLTGNAGYQYLDGDVITITGSTMSGLSNGNYYILTASVSPGNQTVTLTATYRGAAISGIGSGTGTFASFTLSQPVAYAVENYYDGTSAQIRYYVLDIAGYVWVYDTEPGSNLTTWSPVQVDTNPVRVGSGLAVLNGYLIVFNPVDAWCKETSLLGVDWAQILSVTFNASYHAVLYPHFCLVDRSGALLVTDGNFIVSLVPTPAPANTAAVFSYGTYTFSTFTLTIGTQIAGAFPLVGQLVTFTSSGTLPTGITANTAYYVTNGTNSVYVPTAGQFSISATQGGAAISLSGGSGTQYFNSFSPLVSATYVLNQQAMTINDGTPTEVATSIAQLGQTLMIGTQGNFLYQWDGISPTWTNLVPLAENGTQFLLTVNNVVFAFTGQKGNIYVTSGSAASLVISVPDYLAGIPGNPTSYIEPFFQFGQAFFERGRVFFSIQDQASTKTGNCGGIYSFIPSFYNATTGQDTGTALRLENFNSYETYNGLANVIFTSQNQSGNGVQYFSAWTSSVTSPAYGIDFTSSASYTAGETVIETDLVPIGTYIDKGNYTSIQTRYGAPLISGESVVVKYRTNLTDAYAAFQDTTAGTDNTVGSVGARWPAPWANALQVQFQITLTAAITNPSFTRLKELRIGKNSG